MALILPSVSPGLGKAMQISVGPVPARAAPALSRDPAPPRAVGPGPPRPAGPEEDAADPCPVVPSSFTQPPIPTPSPPVASLCGRVFLGGRRVPLSLPPRRPLGTPLRGLSALPAPPWSSDPLRPRGGGPARRYLSAERKARQPRGSARCGARSGGRRCGPGRPLAPRAPAAARPPPPPLPPPSLAGKVGGGGGVCVRA